MTTSFVTPNTLLGAMTSKTRTMNALTSFAVVVLGTMLLTLAAKVSIPFIPVPATFQTMAVAFIAAVLGWRMGVATVALYIVEGLAGLPVFAAGGGLGYVMSPTFGFILGWLPMAYVIGRAADAGHSRSILKIFVFMVAGNAISFALGYFWLIAMAGGASWIDQANVFGSAFDIAVKPFIVWDLLKMAFAAVTVAAGWQLVKSRKA